MKIVFGSDEKNHLTDFVISELRKQNHELVLHGPIADENIQWTDVAQKVAEKVASGESDQGILCCWTGTGVSIAANKVPGIRAALCVDAETASGARKWNDANILAMSLRTTSNALAGEILDAWFGSSPEDEEKENIEKVMEIEKKYSK
jgi:ribose 5-phosphate isomerase B